jgi:hypothetical protein
MFVFKNNPQRDYLSDLFCGSAFPFLKGALTGPKTYSFPLGQKGRGIFNTSYFMTDRKLKSN